MFRYQFPISSRGPMNPTPTLEQLQQQLGQICMQHAQIHVDIQATEDHLAKLRQRAGLLLDDARGLSEQIRQTAEMEKATPAHEPLN